MNGIRNFFTNTLPSWWRNHPYKLLAGGVGSVVVLSGAANALSPKTSDAKPDVDQSTTSYTQTMETTTESTLGETSTYTTTITQTTVATDVSTITETTITTETTGAEVSDIESVFMSDYLKKYIEKVTFEDDLEPYIIDSDSLLDGEGYIVDENGNIINSQGYTYTPEGNYIDESFTSYEGDFYLAPDGLLYTSKEEYEKTLNSTSENSSTTKGEYDENGFYIAPDGSRWNSKQDYEDSLVYIEGEDYVEPSNPGIVEDGFFVDPNGNIWNSEQEYLDFIDPSYNVDNTYIAPDGSVWSSEEDYLKSLEGNVVNPNPDEIDDPVVDPEPPAVEDPIDENDGFYHAPDGSLWTSEQEYIDFVESLKEPETPTVTETTPVEEPSITTTTTATSDDEVGKDGYYEAPDGSKWSSEQDYLDYIDSIKEPETPAVTETTPVEEPATTTTTTTEKVSEETGYYEAPDGSLWTSEEEYNAYIDSFNEMYNTETTTTVTTEQETTTTTTQATTTTVATTEQDVVTTTKQTTTEVTTAQKSTETEATVTDPVQEDDNSGYFIAPDGSYWSSEEDYNEFLDTVSEMGTQKVR